MIPGNKQTWKQLSISRKKSHDPSPSILDTVTTNDNLLLLLATAATAEKYEGDPSKKVYYNFHSEEHMKAEYT